MWTPLQDRADLLSYMMLHKDTLVILCFSWIFPDSFTGPRPVPYSFPADVATSGGPPQVVSIKFIAALSRPECHAAYLAIMLDAITQNGKEQGEYRDVFNNRV